VIILFVFPHNYQTGLAGLLSGWTARHASLLFTTGRHLGQPMPNKKDKDLTWELYVLDDTNKKA
jgi:hypothetical protein